MLNSEVAKAGEQLAARAVIRAEAVDAWVALALEQPDPVLWTNNLVAAALERLALVPQTLGVKAEARLQILDIRRAILVALANTEKTEAKQKLRARN